MAKPSHLKSLRTVLERLDPSQQHRFVALVLEQDDCDICNGAESYWRDAFGDAWCETRNYFCGPDGWQCAGFPKSCG